MIFTKANRQMRHFFMSLHKTLHLHEQYLSAHIFRSASFSINTAFARWNKGNPKERTSNRRQCDFSIFRSGPVRNYFWLQFIPSHWKSRTNFPGSANKLGGGGSALFTELIFFSSLWNTLLFILNFMTF